MNGVGTSSEEELKCLGDKLAETSLRIDVELHRFLTDLRRFDDERGWALTGMLSCAHWLSWRCGIALRAGREKVRVAHALAELPAVDGALREGTVSYSKVRAMTRIATPENEAELLEMAKFSAAAHLEEACRMFGQQNPTGREPERYLTVRETPRGMARATLQLRPEEMARLMEAVDASAATRVDGLLAMVETILRGGEPQRPAAEVMVHIDASTLTGMQGDVGIPRETCLRLLCDSDVMPKLEDAEGNVLEVGPMKPRFSAVFRGALAGRDAGCRFPGCSHRRLLDGHSVKHWVEGGETTLANTLLLCIAHHKLVHEGGFRVEEHAGKVRFFTPRGIELGATGGELGEVAEANGMTATTEVVATNEATATDKFPATFWEDGTIDYDTAVAWLSDA